MTNDYKPSKSADLYGKVQFLLSPIPMKLSVDSKNIKSGRRPLYMLSCKLMLYTKDVGTSFTSEPLNKIQLVSACRIFSHNSPLRKKR